MGLCVFVLNSENQHHSLCIYEYNEKKEREM